MKRVVYILLFIVFGCSLANAQGGRRLERIHAIKVAYLTDKLQLTSEQSERFWPVYNRFEDEKRNLAMTYRKGLKNATDDDESMRSIDDDILMQEKMLDLRKKYKDEFLKIISPKQLATLVESEREFKKLLIQQFKERKGGMDNNRRRPLR